MQCAVASGKYKRSDVSNASFTIGLVSLLDSEFDRVFVAEFLNSKRPWGPHTKL